MTLSERLRKAREGAEQDRERAHPRERPMPEWRRREAEQLAREGRVARKALDR